jgi:flagellar biogenesis protein FliO
MDGELSALARTFLALGAVLVLLLMARRLVARHGLMGAETMTGTSPMRLVASLTLDARNRLVVVRHGEAELILAVGPGGVVRLDTTSRHGMA